MSENCEELSERLDSACCNFESCIDEVRHDVSCINDKIDRIKERLENVEYEQRTHESWKNQVESTMDEREGDISSIKDNVYFNITKIDDLEEWQDTINDWMKEMNSLKETVTDLKKEIAHVKRTCDCQRKRKVPRLNSAE